MELLEGIYSRRSGVKCVDLAPQVSPGGVPSLVIDARVEPHHAPALEEDPEIEHRVDALGAPGGPLHGII